jgi:FKBP-type peptidyl-prolyl cis-trans isomerase
MKTYILFFLILTAAGLVYYYSFYQKEEASEIANPASVLCQKQGGTLNPLEFKEGTKTFCSFEDGSECEEWELYRGECQKGQLIKEILKEGEGQRADKGDILKVHYTGTFLDGEKFDSSLDREEPFSFTLGEGRVIKGWEQGVLGMRAREKRKLIISPELAYGQDGFPGAIPENSTLIFEIELLEINSPEN